MRAGRNRAEAGREQRFADFGAKLPMMVIGAMLGVPAEDRDAIRVWTDASLHREPGETDVSERMQEVHQNLWGYFARYIAEREELTQVGADGAVYEEAEAAVALSRLVLFDRGADADVVRRESIRIRQEFLAPAAS